MIGINTITQNANGAIVIYEDAESEIKRLGARVSRVATLDGGAVITHGGVTDADRTLKVRARIDEDTETKINDIFMSEVSVHVATPIGYFLAALSQFNVDNGDMTLEILIEEKLSA